jgi:hypothetical protein
MIFGIQKRQWLLLLLAISVPLLLNAVAIWQDVGAKAIFQILRGTFSYGNYYNGLDIDHNPFPEILRDLLLFTVPLELLAWFMIFVSNKVFFQKQPLIAKLFEALLMAWLVAVIFKTVTDFFMPLVWLPRIKNTLMLPGSVFVDYWSYWLVFPVTAIIFFIAIFLSGQKKMVAPATTA